MKKIKGQEEKMRMKGGVHQQRCGSQMSSLTPLAFCLLLFFFLSLPLRLLLPFLLIMGILLPGGVHGYSAC